MTTAEMSTRSCQFCGVAVRTSEYGEHLTSFHHINLTSGGPDNTEKVKYYREVSLTLFVLICVLHLQCMFCLERVAAVELPGHVFYHHHISGLYLNTGAAGSCAETVARGAQTEDTDTEEDTLSMQLDTIIPGDDDYQSARIPSPCSHHDDTATASKDDHNDEDTPITLPIVEAIDSSKTDKNLPLQTVIERNDSGDASVRSSDINVIVHDEERSNNSVPTSTKTDDVESTRSEQLHDSCEDDDNDEDSDESDFEMDTCEYKIYNCECNFCKSKEVDEAEACDDDLTVVDETIPSPAETPVTGCDGSGEKQLPDLPPDDTHQNTEPKKKKKKVTFADITNYYPVKKPGWLERLHRSRGRGQGSGGQQQQILGPNTSLKYLRYWGTPNKPPSDAAADAELKLERRRKPRPPEAAKSRNTGSVTGVSVRVNLAEDGETSLRSLGVVWRCPRPGCLFSGDSVKVVRQHFAKHK